MEWIVVRRVVSVRTGRPVTKSMDSVHCVSQAGSHRCVKHVCTVIDLLRLCMLLVMIIHKIVWRNVYGLTSNLTEESRFIINEKAEQNI